MLLGNILFSLRNCNEATPYYKKAFALAGFSGSALYLKLSQIALDCSPTDLKQALHLLMLVTDMQLQSSPYYIGMVFMSMDHLYFNESRALMKQVTRLIRLQL